LIVAGLDLRDSLAAKVIVAPLEHRPRKRQLRGVGTCGFEQREVDAGELVLERLGVGGDDGSTSGRQDGNEIAECLSGSGACLHDQRRSGLDGVSDVTNHVCLSFASFGMGDVAHHRVEQGKRGLRGGAHVDAAAVVMR
jgi:hypothetical protein